MVVGAFLEVPVERAGHRDVSLLVDEDDLRVVVLVAVPVGCTLDETLRAQLLVGVAEALAASASLAALRAPGRFADSAVLARGLLEGPVVGADDGDLGIAVDVAASDMRVVVSAVVQLRREVDELGGSFFTGSGAVVQGVLQESLSWSYAGTPEPAGKVG